MIASAAVSATYYGAVAAGERRDDGRRQRGGGRHRADDQVRELPAAAYSTSAGDAAYRPTTGGRRRWSRRRALPAPAPPRPSARPAHPPASRRTGSPAARRTPARPSPTPGLHLSSIPAPHQQPDGTTVAGRLVVNGPDQPRPHHFGPGCGAVWFDPRTRGGYHRPMTFDPQRFSPPPGHRDGVRLRHRPGDGRRSRPGGDGHRHHGALRPRRREGHGRRGAIDRPPRGGESIGHQGPDRKSVGHQVVGAGPRRTGRLRQQRRRWGGTPVLERSRRSGGTP